jgi:hypothetical protein
MADCSPLQQIDTGTPARSAMTLTVIHAKERGKPKGRDPIDWKLITNLPVSCKADAIEKLDWYAMRWKIETFHKILKSGCRAEDSKLRSAERLTVSNKRANWPRPRGRTQALGRAPLRDHHAQARSPLNSNDE